MLEKIFMGRTCQKRRLPKSFDDTHITILVCQIDVFVSKAANEAFPETLSEERLNLKQIRSVKYNVDYLIKNGTLDKKVLQQESFRLVGSIVDLFKDNMVDVRRIIGIVM